MTIARAGAILPGPLLGLSPDGANRQLWEQSRIPADPWELTRDAARDEDAGPEEIQAALGLLGQLRRQLDLRERDLIEAARGQGVSWHALAATLDLGSKQSAEQRYTRLSALAGRDCRRGPPGTARPCQ